MSELSSTELHRVLAVRDLTDPAAGPHAIQRVVDLIEKRLADAWRLPVRRDPGPLIVTVTDNYDRLGYPPDAVTRDRRYTHYVGDGRMLRSHTTARIPALLADVAGSLSGGGEPGQASEVVLSVPGICYRRDAIDRQHTGHPHQHDVWRIRPAGPRLTGDDLEEMVGLVVTAVLPGRSWRTVPNTHPYTLEGREIYVADGEGEVEIGECGLAHPAVLAGAGLPASSSGLAMGLGLDRLVMLAKGVPDIRLLRSGEPRIAAQLTDLSPYRPVSAMPPVRRDLSLAVDAGLDAELLGDRVRALLGPDADAVEEVELRSETGYDDLPGTARERMGMAGGQKNVLIRLVLRHPSRSLTDTEANQLRDRVYAGLHEGARREWATR